MRVEPGSTLVESSDPTSGDHSAARTDPARLASVRAWARWVWRTLTSMRSALVLLALLALAAVPGSVLPQRNVASDPNAVVRFSQEYPDLAPWLDRLGMFEVYASAWFAAIYILLLVSMTGCVLPRCLRLWQAVRAEPPRAPTNLRRLTDYRTTEVPGPGHEALQAAAQELRRRRFRVRVDGSTVRAERGYARELGNLVFHLSLLVLLLGVAVGRLFGFEGRVALAEGAGFSNVVAQYDEFNPRPFTDLLELEPFTFTLEEFRVQFERDGAKRGEPRVFEADLAYRSDADPDVRNALVRPNHPLDLNATKVFLTGHGYAPVVTVTDGTGETVFTGPVLFLPMDASYASDGVVKVPDARPSELGFEGFFLPTAAVGEQGPYSAFPDALDPRLVLTAYTGDLGLADGVPESVYALDKSGLEQVTQEGEPFARALRVGQTMQLPGGQGSLRFDRVARFANFQIAYDPGKEIALVAATLLLLGLTTSLMVRRRRVWVRVVDVTGSRTVLEIGALPLSRRGLPPGELADLERALVAQSTVSRLAPRAPGSKEE